MRKTKKRKNQSTPGVAFESTATISEPLVSASKRHTQNSLQTRISKKAGEGRSKATSKTQEVQDQALSGDTPLKDMLKRKVFSSSTTKIPRSTVKPHIEATCHPSDATNQEGVPNVNSTPKRAQNQVPTQSPQTFEGTTSQTQPRRTKIKHTSSGSIGSRSLPSLIPAYPIACQVPGDPKIHFFPNEEKFDTSAFICSLISNTKQSNQNISSSPGQNVEPQNQQTEEPSMDDHDTPNVPSQTKSSPKGTPPVQPSHADTTATPINDEVSQNQQTETPSMNDPPQTKGTPPVQPSQTAEAPSDSASKAVECLKKVTEDPVVVMTRIISGEVAIPVHGNSSTKSLNSPSLPSLNRLLSQLKHIVFSNQFNTLIGFEQSIQAILDKVEEQQDNLTLEQDKALADFVSWFNENIKLSQDLNSLENSLSQAFTKQNDYKERLAGKEASLQQTKDSTVAANVKIAELDAVICDLKKKLEQAIEEKEQVENEKMSFQDKEKEIIKSIEVISTECLNLIVSASQLHAKKVIVEQKLEASKDIYEEMKKNPRF